MVLDKKIWFSIKRSDFISTFLVTNENNEIENVSVDCNEYKSNERVNLTPLVISVSDRWNWRRGRLSWSTVSAKKRSSQIDRDESLRLADRRWLHFYLFISSLDMRHFFLFYPQPFPCLSNLAIIYNIVN